MGGPGRSMRAWSRGAHHGLPLDSKTFGGGWVYGMGETDDGKNLVSVGIVVGLDSRDPTLDGHRKLQEMKLNASLEHRCQTLALPRWCRSREVGA